MISKEQIFYEDMERLVHPYTYDGNSFGTCLIGQMVTGLGLSTIEDLERAGENMLSNEQIFYDDMGAMVDLETYNGDNCDFCLIGQMTDKLELCGNDELADAYNLDISVINNIYYKVTEEEYRYDLEAALEYVRQFLGLAEHD